MIQSFAGFSPEIHPDAWVHPDATVIGQVRIARGASVWPRAVLRGDMGAIEVGEDSNVQDGVVCHMTSGISTTVIGARVTVGHGAILHGCRVHDDSLVGMGSILLDNCVIPSRCVVGAGALVAPNKRFEEGVLLLGSPARIARALGQKDLDWIAYSWSHYKEAVARYRAADPGLAPPGGAS